MNRSNVPLRRGALAAAACVLAAVWAQAPAGTEAPPVETPVGGANSPKPSPPPKLVIATGELAVPGPDVFGAGFAVRVPTGDYTAPPGGAPNYAVPGPIVAFRGPDGVWRGHGYLETYPRLLKFRGTLGKTSAELTYTFEPARAGGKERTYRVALTAAKGAVLLDETSELGPRNRYVFDCYYGWLPSSGFAVDLAGRTHAFLTLPCYYDKVEVTINPVAAARKATEAAKGEAKGVPEPKPAPVPGGVAVLSADGAKRDVAGFWCREVSAWAGGDRMGIQLWQHRQLPGDPSSRHFLGPETKSDSTPNPRTAELLGRSLYEGHVMIELSLGVGSRKLGFAATARGAARAEAAEAFKKLVRAHR